MEKIKNPVNIAWMKPGVKVWYDAGRLSSRNGLYSGEIDSEPRKIGKENVVVRLRKMSPYYIEDFGRKFVACASVARVIPRR